MKALYWQLTTEELRELLMIKREKLAKLRKKSRLSASEKINEVVWQREITSIRTEIEQRERRVESD